MVTHGDFVAISPYRKFSADNAWNPKLLAHFRGAQTRVQAGGTELRVGLILAIDDGGDIGQQIGEMGFRTLPPSCRERIKTGEPTGELMRTFANGDPAPPKYTLGVALSPGAEFTHGPSHKSSTGTALERLGSVDKERLDGISEFHGSTSSVQSPGGYHVIEDSLIFLNPLLYAQVIKTTRRRRLVRVSHRVVFGTLAAVQQVLSPLGWQINTSLVERFNLSRRQHVAAIGRRTSTLCKSEAGLCQQLALYHVYYNFVLPHASLRQPLAEPVATKRPGSAKQWRPCTPAMAAGLTDHAWSLRELLLFRVPPWPQPQTG